MTEISRQGRTRRKTIAGTNKKRIYFFMAGLLALVILVAAAFLLPQIIFRVQDDILCGHTVLGQRESMDVEAIRTDYEKSLPRRLANFVEGLKEEEDFYVTARELTIDEEIREYLYSESGLYQGFIQYFAEVWLWMIDIWNTDFTINQWKQYVMYSDNYARGVNFILWYIELQDTEDVILKLLVDGEDGTIYAVKREQNLLTKAAEVEQYDDWSRMRRYLGYQYTAWELWGHLADYYELMTEDMMEEYIDWLEEIQKAQVKFSVENVLSDKEKQVIGLENKSEGTEEGQWYSMEGTSRMILHLPCGESELKVVLEVEDAEDGSIYEKTFPDLTFGISSIYERIPEF